MISWINMRGNFSTSTGYGKLEYTEFDNTQRFMSAVYPYQNGVTKESVLETAKRYDSLSPYSPRKNDIYNLSAFNPERSFDDVMFGMQSEKWEKLENGIASNKRVHVIAFDFETLGVSNPNRLNPYSAVTEFGITDVFLTGNKDSKRIGFNEPVSVALGINNEEQISAYLIEYNKYYRDGLDSVSNKKLRGMYTSDMERFSRYAGNITDVFDKRHVHIAGGQTMVVKSLADSSLHDPEKVLDGMINMTVLGGTDRTDFEGILKKYGVTADRAEQILSMFDSKKADFEAAEFIVQNQQSDVIDKLKGFLVSKATKGNSVVTTFNGNVFDVPIFNQIGKTGSVLNIEDTIDVYSAMQHMTRGSGIFEYNEMAEATGANINIPGRLRQEGLAALEGIPFADTAHNAGSDSRVTGTLALMRDYSGGMSIGQHALDISAYYEEVDLLSKDTYLYATKSMKYGKDGSDALLLNGKGASDFTITGIKRNRYYKLDAVSYDKEKSKVIAKISAASPDHDEVFYKSFDSYNEMAETIRSTFRPESAKAHGGRKAMEKIIQQAEESYWADYARRNYDRFSSINGIHAEGSAKRGYTVKGGYDELNKYYQAYKEAAFGDTALSDAVSEQREAFRNEYKKFDHKRGNTKMVYRDKLAVSNDYDDFFRSVLENNGIGYRDEKSGKWIVTDNNVKNFKQLMGKLHDESELFEYMNKMFSESDDVRITTKHTPNMPELSLYEVEDAARRRTIVYSNVRAKLLENESLSLKNTAPKFNLAHERDLFAFDVVFDSVEAPSGTIIDFGTQDSWKSLINNARRHAKQGSGDINVGISNYLYNAAESLNEKGVVSDDFLQSFTNELKKTDIGAVQNMRYAQAIVNQVNENFVFPMKQAGYNINVLRRLGKDSAPNGFDPALIDIATKKLSAYSGEFIQNAHSTRNQDTYKTLNSIVQESMDELSSYTSEQIDNSLGMNFGIKFRGNSLEGIEKYMIDNLGYDEITAKQAARSFTYASKEARALNAMSYSADTKKLEWMSGFFHSGVKGDDAFVLIGRQEGLERIQHDLSKISDSDEFNRAIKEFGEEGRAAVIPMPALHSVEIDPGDKGFLEDTFSFKRVLEDGNSVTELASYKTIGIGDSNWQKISRKNFNTYFAGSEHTLKNMRMQLTDDAQQVVNWFIPGFEGIFTNLNDVSMTDAEKLKEVTKRTGKLIMKRMKHMPALSGSLNSVEEGGRYIRAQIPNAGDLMKSMQVNINPMQRVLVMTALEELNKDGKSPMAEFIADFLPTETTPLGDRKTADALKKILKNFEEDHEYKFQNQLDEMFKKNFNILTPKMQNPDKYGDFDNTIIEYLHEMSEKHADWYDKSVKASIDTLWANREQITSQLTESAVKDGYVSLVKIHNLVQGAFSDASMRPIFQQALTAKLYNREQIKTELGEDVIKRYGITLDYDAKPLGVSQMEHMFRKVKVGKDSELGDYARAMGVNARQMNTIEAYHAMSNVQANVSGIFGFDRWDKNNAEWIAKYGRFKSYGLDKETTKKLLQESANIYIDSEMFNTYESRGAGNPLVMNNSYFGKPYIKKAELSQGLEDTEQIKKLSTFLEDAEITSGTDLAKLYREYTGDVLLNKDGSELSLIYKGSDGYFAGSAAEIQKFLRKGKGNIVQDVQGIMMEKLYMNSEKNMIATLEWNANNKNGQLQRLIDILENAGIKDQRAQREISLNILGDVWDKAFGEGISIIEQMPLDKHLNSYTNSVSQRIVQVARENLNDDDAYTFLDDIFREARNRLIERGMFSEDYKGLEPVKYNNGIALNYSKLVRSGATAQIDEIAEIISERARDDSYGGIYGVLNSVLKNDAENNIVRGSMSVIEDNESMGTVRRMNARFNMALRSQNLEYLKNGLVTDVENPLAYNAVQTRKGKVFVNNYLTDQIISRASSGQTDHIRSVQNTLHGIHKSMDYLVNPALISDSDASILTVEFDNLSFERGVTQESVDDVMEYGIFKITNDKGTRYSKMLQRAAREQNVDLDMVEAVRIKLPSGIKYEHHAFGNKNTFTDIIVPLYDIKPYRNEFVRTDSIKAIQNVLNMAHNYGSYGADIRQKLMNNRVNNLFTQLASDVSGNKDSYRMKNLMNLDIEGSGTFKSHSISYPMINGIYEDKALYKRWVSTDAADIKWREEVINAVREGRDTKDLFKGYSGKGNPLGFGKYTKEIDGKVLYDSITEVGEGAFRDKFGIDFGVTGYKIVMNSKDYNAMSEISIGKNIDEVLDIASKKKRAASIIEDIKKSGIEFKSSMLRNNGEKLIQAGADKNSVKELVSIFDTTTKDYLEKVGTFGITGRDPMFQAGSAPMTIFKLNRTLSTDEMNLSPIVAALMNDDNDGDTPFGIIFQRNGILDTSTGNLFASWKGSYNLFMKSSSLNPNTILADMMMDEADSIMENGGRITDAVSGRQTDYAVYSKAKRLGKGMSDIDKDEIVTLLRENGAKFGVEDDILAKSDEQLKEYIDELLEVPKNVRDGKVLVKTARRYTNGEINAIRAVYEAWDAVAGNFAENKYMLASATKARVIKNHIGHISNINFAINEELMSKVNALASTGGSMDEILRIHEDLHLRNTGFLTEVEQKAIDVKHVSSGLSIADTPEYRNAMQKIFNLKQNRDDVRSGLGLLYDSLQGNKAFKTKISKSDFVNMIMDKSISYDNLGDKDLQRVRSIVNLSDILGKEGRSRILSSVNKEINTHEAAEQFYLDMNEIIRDDTLKLNSSISTKSRLYKEISEAKDYVKLGYNYNFADSAAEVKNQLIKDAVYFKNNYETVAGMPEMYQFDKTDVLPGGRYKVKFTKLKKDGSLRKNKNLTFEGTQQEIEEVLQKTFGDYRPMGKQDLLFTLQNNMDEILDMQKEVTAQKFLREKIQQARNGNILDAEEFIKRGKRKMSPDDFKSISDFVRKLDSKSAMLNDVLEFEMNLGYIKDNAMNKMDINLDEILNQINKEIIASAKGKKTSTDVNRIFESYYERLSKQAGNEGLALNIANGKAHMEYEKRNLSGWFESYDSDRINLEKVKEEFEYFTSNIEGYDDLKDVYTEEIENEYAQIAEKYGKENLSLIKRAEGGFEAAMSRKDIDSLFDWDKDLRDMRIGFDLEDANGNKTGQWIGRKFSTLNKNEIEKILNYEVINSDDDLVQYAAQETKRLLKDFYDNGFDAENIEELQGMSEIDTSKVRNFTNNILAKHDKEQVAAKNMKEAAQEGAEQAAENAKKGGFFDGGIRKQLGKAWDSTTNFVKEHPKGSAAAGVALLGLGIVNNIMNRNDSPLAPDIKASRGDRGIGHGKKLNANQEPSGVQTYTDPGSGVNFRMSAHAARRVNAMNAASAAGFDTANVNIRDERRPVKDTWLEDKIANYV